MSWGKYDNTEKALRLFVASGHVIAIDAGGTQTNHRIPTTNCISDSTIRKSRWLVRADLRHCWSDVFPSISD